MVLYLVVVIGKILNSHSKFQDKFFYLFNIFNIAVNLVFPSLKLYFEHSENLRDFYFYKIVLSWQLLLDFIEGFHYYGKPFGILTSCLLYCFKHTKNKATCLHCLRL